MNAQDITEGLRVRVQLEKPYTTKEIENGSDPNVDGMAATVVSIQKDRNRWVVDLLLDEELLPNPICPEDYQFPTREYLEFPKNLVPLDESSASPAE